MIYDAPSGGRAIASFTGDYVPMTLSELPPDPAIQRAKVATRASAPTFRIDGYVAAQVVPVYSARDIPIAAGNVWIASAQKLKVTGAQLGALTVEMTVTGSNSQVVRVNAPCDALALQRGMPTPVDVPGNGRGYLNKAQDITVYDGPAGNAVFTLRMATSEIKLFWSTETSGGFIHGILRSDLAIDGWIRSTDLTALPKGEMMDQYIPPETSVAGTKLLMDPPPRHAIASKDIPFRFQRNEKERPIGVIESGAELLVMETIAGWTSVLPAKVYALPTNDGAFWVPANEVPR